jgi:RecA/RadA recombinase
MPAKKTNGKTTVVSSQGSIVDTLKKISGSKYVYSGLDDIMEPEDFISTGNLLLNFQISANPFGMPSNNVLELVGEYHTGKTYVAASIALNAISGNTLTGEKYNVLWFETEGAGSKKRLMSMGFTEEHLKCFNWNLTFNIEDFRHNIYKYLKAVENGELKGKWLFVADSIGNMASKKEIKDVDEDKEKEDMTRAKKIKSMFRLVTLLANQVQVPIILINHVYKTQDFISQVVVGGGESASLSPSTILYFTKSQLKKGEEIVGINVRSKTMKGRDTKYNKKIIFPIIFDSPFDYFGGLESYLKGIKFQWDVGDIKKVYESNKNEIDDILKNEFILGEIKKDK